NKLFHGLPPCQGDLGATGYIPRVPTCARKSGVRWVGERRRFARLAALLEDSGAGLVADVTRSRIAPELRRAAPREAAHARVEARADAGAAVADHAVALDMAAHTRVQVVLGLERVMPGLSRRVAPDLLRRMEAPRHAHVRGCAHRDPQALMARE